MQYEEDLIRLGIRSKTFAERATNGCNLYSRKQGSSDTPQKIKELRCISDPHDDHPETCAYDSIHSDDKLTVGSEASNSGSCPAKQVDFVYTAANVKGSITAGWCDTSNAGKLGDEVCVPCGSSGGTTAATTTTTVTTVDTSGSANTYPKGAIKIDPACPAGSCGEGNKCEGKLVFGYLTAKAMHAGHYHDRESAFSNHFWIFQKDWATMGCNDAKTFTSYIYNPDGNLARQGPFLSRCAGRGDGQDPNTNEATSYMDWPNHRTKPQRGAKVGWIIASAVNCKKQTIPRCKEGHYYNKDQAKCMACIPPSGKCNDGEIVVGECSGATNALTCKKCLAPQSSTEFCPGAPSAAYREGDCSGSENTFKCTAQPTCSAGQFLADFSKTKKGVCSECANLACPDGQYQKGECSGTTNGLVCAECDNGVCDSITLGAEHYQTGTCSTTENSLECNRCSNAACKANFYRTGECTPSTKGFACEQQPLCGRGQYFSETVSADGAVGKGTCDACPEGTHLGNGAHRLPECIVNKGCSAENDEHVLIAATTTNDAICGTSRPCMDYQYESKAIGETEGRECTRVSSCGRGQYVTAAPTSTSDRACGECDGKLEFTASKNAESCTPFSFCTTNQRVAYPGTKTKDLKCGKCAYRTEQPLAEHREQYCDDVTTTTTTETTATSTTTSVTTITETTTTSTSSTSSSTTTPDLPEIAIDMDEADKDVVTEQLAALEEHIESAQKQTENAEQKIALIGSIPIDERTPEQQRDYDKAQEDRTAGVEKVAVYTEQLEGTQEMIAEIEAQERWSASAANDKNNAAANTNTTTPIVVAAVLVLAVAVIAVVVVKRKAHADTARSGGPASFENPFYAAAGDGNGIPASNEAAYMDVPSAFSGATSQPGYMDVSPHDTTTAGQSSGYMDVSPSAGGDDFSDDEEV